MVEVTKTKMRKWARGKEKGTWALAMAAGCNLAESSQVRIPARLSSLRGDQGGLSPGSPAVLYAESSKPAPTSGLPLPGEFIPYGKSGSYFSRVLGRLYAPLLAVVTGK